MEAEVLENIGGRKPPDPPNYAAATVLVFVDEFNLATIAALRYARGLRPTTLRAVHFVIDTEQAERAARGMAPRRARHRARTGGLPRPAGAPGRRASWSPGRPASRARR